MVTPLGSQELTSTCALGAVSWAAEQPVRASVEAMRPAPKARALLGTGMGILTICAEE
jgi:hypothetical protein